MRHADALVTCACAVLIIAVLPLRPFWLDEVLQLIATRPDHSVADVISIIPENPGSAPLGYLVQHGFLSLFGVSRWSARMPSGLFGVAACAATLQLARKLGVIRRWLAALILAFLPLTLRYAAEARPYAQAVFFAVSGSLVFLWFAERPTARRLSVYTATLVAGVYTLPFTVFAAAGHLFWAAAGRRWRLAATVAAAAFAAAASFLPWMLYARSAWRETMVVSHFEFAADWRTPLMLLREITGAGYVGVALLFGLAALGLRALSKQPVALLAGMVGVSFAGGLIADAALGYFVAVRQFICVLPALAILAAARPMPVLVAVLLAVSAWKDVQYFTRATEDWESAVAAIATEVRSGRCLAVHPARDLRVYAALEPSLTDAGCRGIAREMVVAESPYAGQHGRFTIPAGFTVRSERYVGGTHLLVIAR